MIALSQAQWHFSATHRETTGTRPARTSDLKGRSPKALGNAPAPNLSGLQSKTNREGRVPMASTKPPRKGEVQIARTLSRFPRPGEQPGSGSSMGSFGSESTPDEF